MPGSTDGIGLVHWMASHHPGVPIILASGYMVDPGRLETLQVQFLRKPYTLEALANAMALALAQRNGGGSAAPP